MRPIDANALKNDMQEYFDGIPVYMPGVFHVIERAPTIESEVRHGRWINNTFCSECKRFPVPAGISVSIADRELTKYFSWCPHCGAKMEE